MPPAKCGACAKFLSSLEAIKCSKCNALFHRTCVSAPPKSQKTPAWQCPDCCKLMHTDTSRERSRQDDDGGSDEFMDSSPLGAAVVVSTPSTVTDINMELRMFKEELRAEFGSLRREFQLLRTDIMQLKDSVNACNTRIDNLEVRINVLESSPEQKDNKSLEVDDMVAQLRQELNERNQELLCNVVEISNIPEPASENVSHTVKLIASKLGMKLDDQDIVSTERVGKKHIKAVSSAGSQVIRPRRIVVRLARRDVRDELLRNARVRRGATTADLDMPGPPQRFYINECLTKQNQLLFRLARETGQRRGWQYVWTKRGRILVRQKEGGSASVIRTEQDILRVFGPAYLYKKLQWRHENNHYATRPITNPLAIPQYRTSAFRGCFKYAATHCWNNIPPPLRSLIRIPQSC